MTTMPAQPGAVLRTLAHAATRDFASFRASSAMHAASVDDDLDAIAEFILGMLRAAQERLPPRDRFDDLIAQAVGGIGHTQCIAAFMDDPSRPAGTRRELNAKQMVWVHLELGLAERRSEARSPQANRWEGSVRTLRRVQDAFRERVMQTPAVVELIWDRDTYSDTAHREERAQLISAFANFVLGWLRVVCPRGEMDSLLLAVSGYGDL